MNEPSISDIRIQSAAEALVDLLQSVRKLKFSSEYFRGYCAGLEFAMGLLGIALPPE